MPKLIRLCAECADYDRKRHRCRRGASREDDPRNTFYDDCPLPDATPVLCVRTNQDWLGSLSTVEQVNWIKNEAAAMSDAELLKWMEEVKHE